MICLLADTVRIACRRMTPLHLSALSDNMAQAGSVPAKKCWERKAAGHAASIGMLGDPTGDPALVRVAGDAAGWIYDAALALGPSVDGIFRNSHGRLLGHLRDGDPAAASQEIEHHMRTLSFLKRLYRSAA
jgi:DNA-binding GntR family transcriptional regulator